MGMNLFSMALIVLGVIQIIMIIKFFEIADDIRSIRRGFFSFLQDKETSTEKKSSNTDEINTQKNQKEDVDPSKFTWQSWVMIIIIIIVSVCIFIFN